MIKTLVYLIPALALAASPAFAQGGFLGVSLEPAQAGAHGAQIASVQERSAAAVMGLRVGDVVHAVDGVTVADAAALSALISSRLPGEIVELELTRDGASQRLLGVLARRPDALTRREARMPGAMTLPPLPALPARPEMLPMPEWPELQLWHDFGPPFNPDTLRNLQPMMQDLELRLKGMAFLQSGEALKAGNGTSVQLRYPADTPPDEQERLRSEAVAKYGEEVSVEFKGTGTSVTIQRHNRSSLAPAPTPTPAPGSNQNREF